MKILCIPSGKLPSEWISTTCALPVDFFAYMKDEYAVWIERAVAENDETYKQIIPYILIENAQNKFLCYRRHGSENRLHGFYSCGIGGHIDICDKEAGLWETVRKGMFRELSEELANFDEKYMDIEYKGIINEIETAVSRVHLGLVFRARCKDGFTPRTGSELADGLWAFADDMLPLAKERWSELALGFV